MSSVEGLGNVGGGELDNLCIVSQGIRFEVRCCSYNALLALAGVTGVLQSKEFVATWKQVRNNAQELQDLDVPYSPSSWRIMGMTDDSKG